MNVEQKIKYGEQLFLTGKWDEAESCYRQAIDDARRYNNLHWQTVGSCGLANIYRNQGNYYPGLNSISSDFGPR